MWAVKTACRAKVATEIDSINHALRMLCSARPAVRRDAVMGMPRSPQSPLRASLFMLQETFHVNRTAMVVHCKLKKT
jgi:hypothetical protein